VQATNGLPDSIGIPDIISVGNALLTADIFNVYHSTDQGAVGHCLMTVLI